MTKNYIPFLIHSNQFVKDLIEKSKLFNLIN